MLSSDELSMRINLYKQTLLISLFLLSGCFLCVLKPAHAVVVERLYEVEIPVLDQSRKERSRVFQQAMQQVVIRVAGTSKVLGQPAVDEAMKKVSKYISQFRYKELPENFPATPEGEDAMTSMLWINFDAQAINNLLQVNNLPVWGKQRPTALVWLAVRDGPDRYVVRHSDISPLKDELVNASLRRGLPLAWPKYDETDQQQLGFVDLWGGFWENIISASARYNAQSILVGRMDWQGHSWAVHWDLLQNTHQKGWEINSPDIDLLMAQGIDQATDRISKNYSVVSGNSEAVAIYIDIHGIKGLRDYAKINQYLQSLAQIKDVFASELSDTGVRFKVDTLVGEADLKRALALGQFLQPVNVQATNQAAGQGDIVLAYELTQGL